MNHTRKKLILLNGGKYTQKSLETGLSTWVVERYRANEIVIMTSFQEVKFYYQNQEIDFNQSVLYNRFSRHNQFVGLVYEYFQNINQPVINCIQTSYQDAFEKIAQTLRAATFGVPIPDTLIMKKQAFLTSKETIVTKLSFPVVCKTDGQKGEQVKKIDSLPDLEKFVKELDEEIFVIQEFIKNNFDVRVIIAYGEIMGAIKRFPAPNSFLNNFSQGGEVSDHTPTEEEIRLAKQVCKINRTDIAGVDIIHKEGKPLFLELNIGFGVEGFESIHQNQPVFEKIGEQISKKFNDQ